MPVTITLKFSKGDVICDATCASHVSSQINHRANSLTYILVILEGTLLATTLCAAILYFRQLRRIQREYEQAKGVIQDIVLSFNRQIEREAEKLEVTAYKVEANSSKIERTSKATKVIDAYLDGLKHHVDAISDENINIKAKLNKIVGKLDKAIESQNSLTNRFSDLEQKTAGFPALGEPNIEAVIPIKRKKALDPLTNTELSVLKLLAVEGHQTAPRIRSRIRLSREHTSRLMKKLYDDGYLERNTNSVPFKYWVKEEMKRLLNESEAAT